MNNRRIQQFQSLVFSQEVFEALFTDHDRSPQDQAKLLEALSLLNDYGTQKDYLGSRIKHTKRDGLWELRVKGSSKTEWRVLFKHLGNSSYGLLHLFLKKDSKIQKRDFETANRIADREGW